MPCLNRRCRLRMNAIRLIAVDLDGTLLRSDGTISPRTVDVLATRA